MAAQRLRNRFAAGVLALVLFPAAVGAASICRWVDDNGRTQMSDVVPPRYKDSATCTSFQPYQAPAQPPRDAERRTPDDPSPARSQAPGPQPDAAAAATAPAAAAPQAVVKRPTEIVTDATDCPTWWRVFEESSACFGAYRTVSGGVKAEAFDQCNVVPSPEPKCGPRRD